MLPRSIYGPCFPELRRLMEELDAQLSLLCDEWKRIHEAD
jgi:hypothetical protein